MSHYTSLNALMATYGARGFSAVGYPSNEFGGQEPGDGLEILHCVQYVRPGSPSSVFTPAFPLTVKVSVNGGLADGTWAAMKKVCPGFGSGNMTDEVQWNWETILFDKQGKPFRRYGTAVDPKDLAGDIEALLAA